MISMDAASEDRLDNQELPAERCDPEGYLVWHFNVLERRLCK